MRVIQIDVSKRNSSTQDGKHFSKHKTESHLQIRLSLFGLLHSDIRKVTMEQFEQAVYNNSQYAHWRFVIWLVFRDRPRWQLDLVQILVVSFSQTINTYQVVFSDAMKIWSNILQFVMVNLDSSSKHSSLWSAPLSNDSHSSRLSKKLKLEERTI